MVARADIVKISDEDLDWIAPGSGSLEEKARAFLADGVQLVIVTRGSDGALGLMAGDVRVEVPARKATVVDTVGAGDTFNAGFLSELASRNALSKTQLSELPAADVTAALEKGAAVAAITVSRAGANPPWAQELAEPYGPQ